MTTLPHARIYGPEWSAVVDISPAGRAVWRYLGTRTGDLPADRSRWRTHATYSLDEDIGFPLLPTKGVGWFGPPALEFRASDGKALTVDFTECGIEPGHNRLTAELLDPLTSIAATVEFEVVEGGALRLSTSIENRGPAPVTVERLASAVIPLAFDARELRSWRGVHGAELAECREAMPSHGWVRETRRGIGGHGGPPGFYCLGAGATRDAGLVIALQLAWSGNSRLRVEKSDEGGWIACAEASLEPGELTLAPGAPHTAPPVYLAISTGGTNGAMAQQHATVRGRIAWPDGAMAPRPVHLNTWEACYFRHSEERLTELAQAAAALGVERFVLDDGWFKCRREDRRALGDWTPDPEIYPHGLAPLARAVENLGMQFGLWVEPEMVNPDSDLYRAHPDWALALPGRGRPTARHQLVLDMRRPEVRDYLFASLDRLLREVPIRYLKWDHNRDLAPPGGAAQVQGTYDLLARLREAHPALEIESCAGGGGRSDAGIAAFTHRFWTSDNLDAVSRVAIQRGFVSFLPPEVMGAHVGAAPSHATGRSQSLAFRAAVACMGHFGVELDPTKLSEAERAELGDWIAFYKRWRTVIHGGELRLGEGDDGLVWQAHGDGLQWLVFVVRTQPPANRRPAPLALPFARGGAWRVSLEKLVGASAWRGAAPWEERAPADFPGGWLADSGLPLPALGGEAVAIFHLSPVP